MRFEGMAEKETNMTEASAQDPLVLVHDRRAELARRTNAFFSVSLSAAGDARQRGNAQRCVSDFVKRTGWAPDARTIFAGALRYSRYHGLVRFLMRCISKAAGGDTDTSRDYEYTDWAAVDSFAAAFAARLG